MSYNGGFGKIFDGGTTNKMLPVAPLGEIGLNIIFAITGKSSFILGTSYSGIPKIINGGGSTVAFSIYDKTLKTITYSQFIDRYNSININIGYKLNF